MITEELYLEFKTLLNLQDDIKFSIEEPPKGINSDFATNLLLQISKKDKIKPEKFYQEIVKKLEKSKIATDFVFSKPGFINFNISKKRLIEELQKVKNEKDKYPVIQQEKPESILIDFVSSNPTGPLHIGHGRCAVIGDILSRILSFIGHKVQKEYYINDSGTQIEILGKSVRLKAEELKGEKSPSYYRLEKGEVNPSSYEQDENLYRGKYIEEIAKDLLKEYDNKIPEPEIIQKFAIEKILNIIKKDLHDFRVEFDSWVYESDLIKNGLVETTIKELEKKGLIYEKDNALWFKSEQFGDEKDRVIRKSEGKYTYFGTDIAYHKYKFNRGFEKLIDIWGADHHGYINRIKSAVISLGYKEENLVILLYQLVSLLRAGERVRMSTRAGEFITLKEVIDEIGIDSARYFLSTKSPSAHLEFDLEVAKKKSSENPVYYIQYAHTRCCGILREAMTQKDLSDEKANLELLNEKEEILLMKKILFYPDILLMCARNLTPHHLAMYLLDFAGIFHKFYDTHRVITENREISRARLYLIKAVKTVLKNGLDLLGISAPERM